VSSFGLDFICVGPQRTGTTWLYEVLRRHPSVCVPEAVKETRFFDCRYDRGLSWYARYFSESQDNKLCGEVAPTYFDFPEVPKRVYETAPRCDIIITLRHPAERAFSLYLHHLRKGRVKRPFRRAIEQKPRIIEAGRYANHIPRWRSVFGEQRVHFVFLEDIRSQPQILVNQICDWLGVEPTGLPNQAREKVNAASMPRFRWLAKGAEFLTSAFHAYGLHRIVDLGKKIGLKKLAYTGGEDKMPELAPKDRRDLIQEYEQDIAFVEKATGRRLPYWRE